MKWPASLPFFVWSGGGWGRAAPGPSLVIDTWGWGLVWHRGRVRPRPLNTLSCAACVPWSGEQWAVNQISQPVWTVLTIIKHGVGDTRDRGTPGTGGQALTVNELRDGGDQSPRCPWPRLNPDRVDPEPDTDYTEIQRYRARGIQSRGLHSFRILITIHGVCSGYLHFSIYYLSDCSQEIVSK